MAHFITTLRIILLLPLVYGALQPTAAWQTATLWLLVLVFPLDALDGYLARRLQQTSLFGAFYDMWADRFTEIVLWLLAVYLSLAPLWVPIVVIVRGLVTDSIRLRGAARGIPPLALADSRFSRFLVAGRTMRFSYAGAKMVTFLLLLYIHQETSLGGAQTDAGWQTLRHIADGMIYLTVALCLARGLPVLKYGLGGLDTSAKHYGH